jgi:S-adenosylmethionine hydrolase
MPIITFLTDFGTADGYVAEMKGVLFTELPTATIVDVAHDIPAHDLDAGRLAIARYWRRFPRGTVHLAVVDPGVGSTRAAIAVESEGRFLVGPDNGLLSPALLVPAARAVRLDIPVQATATFHGRDVFAPAAARLAMGTELTALGVEHPNPVIRRTPEPQRGPMGELVGQVLTIDRFGNAVTNLVGMRGASVVAEGRELPLKRTYSDLDPGQAGAVVGSTGLIEIVVREGRASDVLSLTRGSRVWLR